MSVNKLKLEMLRARPDARAIDQVAVIGIAQSFQRLGQLKAIIVRSITEGSVLVYEVVAGLHRVEAARLLGLAELACDVRDLGDAEAELVMLDENLATKKMTPAERALTRARQKVLYLEVHPQTRAGVAGANALHGQPNDNLSFAQLLAAQTGSSKRSIERDNERGQKIPPEILRLVIGTLLDSGVELDALADLPFNEQKKLANRAAAKKKVSARPDAPKKSERAAKQKIAAEITKNDQPSQQDDRTNPQDPNLGKAADSKPDHDSDKISAEPDPNADTKAPPPPSEPAPDDDGTDTPIIDQKKVEPSSPVSKADHLEGSREKQYFDHAIEHGIKFLEENVDRAPPAFRLAYESCLTAARNREFETEIMLTAFAEAGRHAMKLSISMHKERLDAACAKAES